MNNRLVLKIGLAVAALIFSFTQAEAATLKISDDGDGPVAEWEQEGSGQERLPPPVMPQDALPPPLQGAEEMEGGRACPPLYTSQDQGEALVVNKGDLISEHLSDWARYHGYDLSWEASEYQSEGNLTLNKGFDETLTSFRDAMEANGIELNINIYENCVVRVVEIK